MNLSNPIDVVSNTSFLQSPKKSPILIKVGGAALKDPNLIVALCKDLSLIRSAGIPLIIVHGGGPSINEELTYRGISWTFEQGQRVTTDEMMEVVETVLCGKVNQRIVRTLYSCGIPAVGLSGTDGGLLLCRRSGKNLGNVGEVESVSTELLSMLLKSQEQQELGGNQKSVSGFIPVIAPIGIDKDGNPLNVNADWAATQIAQALGIRKLVYVTDQDGILDSQGDIMSDLDSDDLKTLIRDQVVAGGMLAKVNTILDGIQKTVSETHIINAKQPHSLIDLILKNLHIGTLCKATVPTKEGAIL